MFYETVQQSLLHSGSVALWCGIPLRIWVAGKAGEVIIHEFFQCRKDNIDELSESMPLKTPVYWE